MPQVFMYGLFFVSFWIFETFFLVQYWLSYFPWIVQDTRKRENWDVDNIRDVYYDFVV